jgi:carboxypeptidase Q
MFMKYRYAFFLVLMLDPVVVFCQDKATVKSIFDTELRQGTSYENLDFLTTKIGSRLSGSTGAAAAVEWCRGVLSGLSDTVIMQPVMVPHWVRGGQETGRILSARRGVIPVNVCALGNAVGTGNRGVSGLVVEVSDFEQLKKLGTKNIQGKLVFFNRPMDPTLIHTFDAYSAAVDQRASGPSEAAKYGAIGVIVRSMSTNIEDYPHTGSLVYAADVPQLPAIAISTLHADLLHQILEEEKDLRFFFETDCEMLPDAPSYNVIGEIEGTEKPDEIIVVGGHLDSWDLAQGAHDDGAGIVQSIEVLRLLKLIGYKPKRTIRAVMYMNEENGLRGAEEYARLARLDHRKHIAAIESDEGGFTPRGFNMNASEQVRQKIKSWRPLLEAYGLTNFDLPGGAADIGPMEADGVPCVGYMPDSQRYFDYHHTKEDTFDKVDQRELELGAAAMASLVYLIDQHGL